MVAAYEELCELVGTLDRYAYFNQLQVDPVALAVRLREKAEAMA